MSQLDKPRKYHYTVFFWTLFVIILDQATKLFIVYNVPLNNFSEPYAVFWGGYLNIIHVRNLAVAFSIGSGLSEELKLILLKILPLLMLFYIAFIILTDKNLHTVQRRAFATIVGGGLGNLTDRFFRPLGVVDFIDTDFWDININWSFFQYRMYRWPTFNFADACVLMGVTVFIAYTLFFIPKPEREHILQNLGTLPKKSNRTTS